MQLKDIKPGMMLRVTTSDDIWLLDTSDGNNHQHKVNKGFIDLIVGVKETAHKSSSGGAYKGRAWDKKSLVGVYLKLTKGFMFVDQKRLDNEIDVFDNTKIAEHVAKLGGLELLSEFIDLVLSEGVSV